MMPTLCDGDYVLVRTSGTGRRPGRGDIVCLRRSGEPRLIKRLGLCTPDGRFRLSGDGVTSQPSVDLGVVAMAQIEGRVVARISGTGVSLVRRPAAKV